MHSKVRETDGKLVVDGLIDFDGSPDRVGNVEGLFDVFVGLLVLDGLV